MCTVTFLPLGGDRYILTSSRDESPDRKSNLPPEMSIIHEREVFFPKDPKANGTWIAADRRNFTLCLLNGAFEKHQRKSSYRLSRGIMLLDFFRFQNIDSFISGYDFTDIEPFTLIVIDGIATLNLHELRWDGEQLHLKPIETEHPKIWSSVTLYDAETIRQRELWFSDWLKEDPEFSTNSIIDFHKHGGRGDLHNNFVMNRNERVKTLSITAVNRGAMKHEMVYEDLVNGDIQKLELGEAVRKVSQ